MKISFIKKWKLWAFLPVVAMIGLIFYFSLQPGNVSDVTSGRVAEKIYEVLDGGRNPLNMVQKDLFNSFIRVFAHMAEFALLAVLVGVAVTVNGIRRYLRRGSHIFPKSICA